MSLRFLLRPAPQLSRKEVCWQNLLFADKYAQIEVLCSSFVGFLQARYEETKQDLNLQEVEQLFRLAGLRTHLVAIVPPPERECYDYRVFTTREKVPRKYACNFVCRERDLALQELLQTSGSYEENFAKLLESGTMMSGLFQLLESDTPVNLNLSESLITGKYLIVVV